MPHSATLQLVPDSLLLFAALVSPCYYFVLLLLLGAIAAAALVQRSRYNFSKLIKLGLSFFSRSETS
jgi:hypothetical protein